MRRRTVIALALVLAAAAAAVVVVASRDGSDENDGIEIAHVHGLGVNPADNELYVATHHGVFVLPRRGKVRRVGAATQDTMGFTVVGPNRFVASGHPGFAPVTRLSDPPHLGLIASDDGGVTWEPRSLRGQADFHGLVSAHGLIYGYNSRAEQFMVSPDGREWDVRSTVPMLSFAVDPANPEDIIASDQQGLVRSDDGGRTWTPSTGPALALLAWVPESGPWAATLGGELTHSVDGGISWDRVSRLPGAAAALLVEPKRIVVAVSGGIYQSRDRGRTWTVMYRERPAA